MYKNKNFHIYTLSIRINTKNLVRNQSVKYISNNRGCVNFNWWFFMHAIDVYVLSQSVCQQTTCWVIITLNDKLSLPCTCRDKPTNTHKQILTIVCWIHIFYTIDVGQKQSWKKHFACSCTSCECLHIYSATHIPVYARAECFFQLWSKVLHM